MALPILSELAKNPSGVEDKTCGPHNCESCPAFSARECDGCTTHYRDETCTKAVCTRQCLDCGGSGGSEDDVMAVCGRPHSMRDTWYKEIGGFSFDYSTVKTRPAITHPDRFIPALVGPTEWKESLPIPSKHPQIKLWACSAQHLFHKNGNPVSEDFKDFLGLSKDQKLLMTMLFMEKYVEMLWRRSDSGFEQFNVDFWSTLTASVHLEDCKFMQHFNSKRQMLYMAQANPHIINYTLGAVKTPAWYKPLAGVVQNVMLYTFAQFRRHPLTVSNYRARLRAILALDPGHTSIFFDMITDKAALIALAGESLFNRLQRERYYVINKQWLFAAWNSWRFLNPEDAKLYQKTSMPREERAMRNLTYLLDMWGSSL